MTIRVLVHMQAKTKKVSSEAATSGVQTFSPGRGIAVGEHCLLEIDPA